MERANKLEIRHLAAFLARPRPPAFRACPLAIPAFLAISLRFFGGIFLRASTAAWLALIAISRRRSGVSDCARIRANAAAGLSMAIQHNSTLRKVWL